MLPNIVEPNPANDRSEEYLNSRIFKVLLIDDSPGDVFIIREILEHCGLHVEINVADDGVDAIALIQSLEANPKAQCPAMILLDLNLPRKSGVEVLTHIRRHSRCCQVPVIIITSSDASSDRRAVQQLGANVYFRKPADLMAYQELGNIVRPILVAAPQPDGSE